MPEKGRHRVIRGARCGKVEGLGEDDLVSGLVEVCALVDRRHTVARTHTECRCARRVRGRHLGEGDNGGEDGVEGKVGSRRGRTDVGGSHSDGIGVKGEG